MRKREMGIAQIPLMLGLLLMAVALPAVTKLSKQNQDNRNRAAGQLSIPIALCSCNNGVYTGINCPSNALGQPCGPSAVTPAPGSCGPMPSVSCPLQGQIQVCKDGTWRCGVKCTEGDLGHGCCNGAVKGHQIRDINCRITCEGNYGACNITPTAVPIKPGTCTSCSTFELQCTTAGGTVTTANGIKYCGFGGTATCAGVTGGGGDPCLNNGGICSGTSIQKCKCGNSYIAVNMGADCNQACTTAGISCGTSSCNNTEGPGSTPLPTNPIRLPTSTPRPTDVPTPLACGEICGQGVACANGLTCVTATNGGKYCSMPSLATACSANPSMGSCCATSITPPVSPSPTIRIPTPSVTNTPTPSPTKIPTPTNTNTPTPTPTSSVCKNCQYQTDLFWGPVIESFNGGVRYSTLNRLIAAKSNFSSMPGCVLSPAPKLPAPTLAPMPSECTNPISKGLLTGSIDTTYVNIPNGYIKGKVSNKSTTCSYEVGLAAYKASGSNIDTQNMYDYKTQNLGPGESVEFVVKSPMNNDDISCHNLPPVTPTPTKNPGVCRVSFDIGDTAVCWKEPRKGVPVTFTVHSLPTTGGPYYVQTDWYIVHPTLGPHHYDWSQKAEVGKKYTIYADWPGIPDGYKGTVENHAGINIVDQNGKILSPACDGGMDFYWTPYVTCPELTKTPTPTPGACVFPPPKDPPKASCAPAGGKGSIDWIWPAVSQSNEYEVDIYKSNGTLLVNNDWRPASDFNCQNGGDCKFTTDNLPVGSYYSRVRARNLSVCQASAWSKSNNISVTNCTTPTPIISCNKKLDISIVIDRTGSMTALESDKRTKLEWAKDAAKTLVQSIQKAQQNSAVRVSVVSFGAQGNDNKGTLSSSHNSILHTALTNNHSQVLSSVSAIKYIQSGTCIECGLRIGNSQLTDQGTRRVEILLSDGMANKNWNGTGYLSSTNNPIVNAKNEANKGRANGIEYRTIGFGRKDIKGQIDEGTLIAIAGSNANYQYKPNASDWSNAFIEILADLCK